jgi:hypothetical protein
MTRFYSINNISKYSKETTIDALVNNLTSFEAFHIK